MMKKTVFILLASLLVFSSCRSELRVSSDERTYDIASLNFDFHINRQDGTKGVRAAWQSGDVVFVFFGGVSEAYVTVTHNGSAWGSPVLNVRDGQSSPSLSSTGSLTAVFLPYGNGIEPSYSSGWTFPGTNDYYYLKAENITYYITDTGNAMATLGAFIDMELADGYAQFFIPCASPDGTMRLACNALEPTRVTGVGLDGKVTELDGTPGQWVTAREDTIDGETGYYASGRLATRPGNYYYLAIEHTSSGSVLTCRDCFKYRTDPIMEGKAYQFPALDDWSIVSSNSFIEIAGNRWCQTNSGSDRPWLLGTSYTDNSTAVVSDTAVPTDDEWNVLSDRTHAIWVQMRFAGIEGYIVMDRYNMSKYIFIPYDPSSGTNYWSSVSGHYYRFETDKTHEVKTTGTPSNALVRLVSTLTGTDFNPPVDGGEI